MPSKLQYMGYRLYFRSTVGHIYSIKWSRQYICERSAHFSRNLTQNRPYRQFSSTSYRGIIPGSPLPFDELSGEENEESGKSKKDSSKDRGRGYEILMKCIETAGIMVASLSMLGLAGLIYHRSYKERALGKMTNAFTNGNPAFELSMHNRSGKGGDVDEHW